MNRRDFLVSSAASTLATMCATLPAFAGAPVSLGELEAEFNSSELWQRKNYQQMLSAYDYYDGAIDGAWGPGTASGYQALMDSTQYKKHAQHWTFQRRIQIRETLGFYNSDAYMN